MQNARLTEGTERNISIKVIQEVVARSLEILIPDDLGVSVRRYPAITPIGTQTDHDQPDSGSDPRQTTSKDLPFRTRESRHLVIGRHFRSLERLVVSCTSLACARPPTTGGLETVMRRIRRANLEHLRLLHDESLTRSSHATKDLSLLHRELDSRVGRVTKVRRSGS